MASPAEQHMTDMGLLAYFPKSCIILGGFFYFVLLLVMLDSLKRQASDCFCFCLFTQPYCSLHLHLHVSANPYTSGNIASRDSAPGIIVASGELLTHSFPCHYGLLIASLNRKLNWEKFINSIKTQDKFKRPQG